MVSNGSDELVARCRCGAVEIHAHDAPIASVICHCDDCRKGAELIESLPDAGPVRDHDGGTRYVLFRRERVGVERGAHLIGSHKLREKSHTRRNVTRCCNTALFIDFDNWRPWVSVYGAAVAGVSPAPEMRLFTKYAAAPTALPTDPPEYATYPGGLPLRIMRGAFATWLGL